MKSGHHQKFPYDNEASASSKPINLKLILSNEVSSPVFTGQNIAGKALGDDGNKSIKVILVDGNTGETITTGSLAAAKVKMVLLRGDYGGSTTREFKQNIVINWEKKKNILLGDVYVDLQHGCGTVGEIRIKHDSKHLKNVKFRLGAMVVDCPITYVVEEAITDPFLVKDKHILPKRLRLFSLEDTVGRLMNISYRRTSKIRMRLESKSVRTVGEFLNMHSSNPLELQEICGLKGKKWKDTVNHAKTSLNENVHNESAFQQSNTSASDDYDDSIEFDNDCYKPQPCEDQHLSLQMMIDPSFSIEDYFDQQDACFNVFESGQANEEGGTNGGWALINNSVEGSCEKAKKRWMKLRIFSFWIGVGVGMGVGLVG